MQTQKKDALLVTHAPLDDTLAARLMETIVQSSIRAVALSVSKEHSEVDSLLYKQVILPLTVIYNQEFPSAPAFNKDYGYVISECRSEYREDHHPFQAFADRIEKSVDRAAVIIFLQDGSAKVHFPNLGVSIPERKGLAIIFPGNWWYKPTLIAEGSSFIVTTFLTHA